MLLLLVLVLVFCVANAVLWFSFCLCETTPTYYTAPHYITPDLFEGVWCPKLSVTNAHGDNGMNVLNAPTREVRCEMR